MPCGNDWKYSMIIGIGTDIIEVERVRKACTNPAFVKRIYTEKELAFIKEDKGRYVTNFAVKEAVSKMLGTGFINVMPIEIEVLREESGKPYVNLYGEAENRKKELHIDDILVTISDTKEYAVAYVIGQSKEDHSKEKNNS